MEFELAKIWDFGPIQSSAQFPMCNFTPKRSFRRAWKVVFWNTIITLASLLMVAILAEFYLRINSNYPFKFASSVRKYVPEVGWLHQPHSVFRNTDQVEYWTESRVNRLGFLEREPLAPKRAAESCHIAIIGDSFVEGSGVRLTNRFPVLLEDLAKKKLPELDVTTSAYGLSASGQIQQIPFYDHYASKMKPALLVLVFVYNDFWENSPFLYSLKYNWDPDHLPYASARKSETGEISLHPPDPEFANLLPVFDPNFNILPHTFNLFVGNWLLRKLNSVWYGRNKFAKNGLIEKLRILRKRPQYASLMADWDDRMLSEVGRRKRRFNFLMNSHLMAAREALEFMAFGLDQFQERADRDGASLAILATESMSMLDPYSYPPRQKPEGRVGIDLLREMADASGGGGGIPVIDLYEYATRLGGRIEDRLAEMRYVNDYHWNRTGHRRAAAAVLEYLKEHPAICDSRTF